MSEPTPDLPTAEWAEVHDALEAAGVQMRDDYGACKTLAEGVRKLAAENADLRNEGAFQLRRGDKLEERVHALVAECDTARAELETYKQDTRDTWQACLEAVGIDFTDLDTAEAEADRYGPKPSDVIRGKFAEARAECERRSAVADGMTAGMAKMELKCNEQAATIAGLREALADLLESVNLCCGLDASWVDVFTEKAEAARAALERTDG